MVDNSWQECIKSYEYLKQQERWTPLADAMLSLIRRILADREFPETVHFVSHAWLRIGPKIDQPNYRPSVWIGWRKPNYYWMGVGSFGTQRRITVTADKALPMLKRYLRLLSLIDPVYAGFVPPTPELETQEAWAADIIIHKYAALDADEVLPALAEDLAEQISDVREISEQLREILKSVKQMDVAQHALDEILKRAERIDSLLNTGVERYRQTAAPDENFQLNGNKA